MRSSHVTVLEMPVQFRVFSWNLEHVGCSRRLLSTQSELPGVCSPWVCAGVSYKYQLVTKRACVNLKKVIGHCHH